MYEVVRPLGKSTVTVSRPTPSLSDLKGKAIGFLSVGFSIPRDETVMRTLESLFLNNFEGLKVVELRSGDNGVWNKNPDKTFGKVAKEAGVNAVILGVAG